MEFRNAPLCSSEGCSQRSVSAVLLMPAVSHFAGVEWLTHVAEVAICDNRRYLNDTDYVLPTAQIGGLFSCYSFEICVFVRRKKLRHLNNDSYDFVYCVCIICSHNSRLVSSRFRFRPYDD